LAGYYDRMNEVLSCLRLVSESVKKATYADSYDDVYDDGEYSICLLMHIYK